MNGVACQAIQRQRILELRYHGYSRIVEPHSDDVDNRGDEAIRCYQFAGSSGSGGHTDWEMLKVHDAVAMHMAETQFVPRADHRPADKVIAQVYCKV